MKPAIKGGLLVCLSLIASALFLPMAFGQRRPGTAVGGITGRPPGFSGGVTGVTGIMPGRPPGFSGGVTGVTGGISGIRPGGAIGGQVGGVTGMGGVGGITGMGRTEWVYTCTVCGKEVMRSPVRLSNVKNCCLSPTGGGGVIGVRPPPGVQNPGPAILPPMDTGVKPPVVQPAPFVPAPAFTDSSDPSTSASGGSSGVSGAFLMIGIGTAVFGLIILAGVIVLVVQSQKGGAGAPRRRRYRDDDY